MNIKLKRIALGQLIASAYGVLSVETRGILVGEIANKKSSLDYVIEAAHPVQSAWRTPSRVVSNAEEECRVKEILNGVGHYHSHLRVREKRNGSSIYSAGRVYLSITDKESIINNYVNAIELVIAMNSTERVSSIRVTPHTIRGCFLDDKKIYRVEIGGYYLDESLRKRRARVSARRKDLNYYFE